MSEQQDGNSADLPVEPFGNSEHAEMQAPTGNPQQLSRPEPLTGGTLDDPINSQAMRAKALAACKDRIFTIFTAPMEDGGYEIEPIKAEEAVDKAEFIIDTMRAYSTDAVIAEAVYSQPQFWE